MIHPHDWILLECERMSGIRQMERGKKKSQNGGILSSVPRYYKLAGNLEPSRFSNCFRVLHSIYLRGSLMARFARHTLFREVEAG